MRKHIYTHVSTSVYICINFCLHMCKHIHTHVSIEVYIYVNAAAALSVYHIVQIARFQHSFKRIDDDDKRAINRLRRSETAPLPVSAMTDPPENRLRKAGLTTIFSYVHISFHITPYLLRIGCADTTQKIFSLSQGIDCMEKIQTVKVQYGILTH